MTVPGHATAPPRPGSADVADVVPEGGGREAARLLRWVRVATIAMLVLLATTAWRDAWPTPGVDAAAAASAIGVWLLATNAWSLAHDRRSSDGTVVEVLADVTIALAMTVLGGDLVAETLPLLGVLVVVEGAVRLPRRTAVVVTSIYVAVNVVVILLQWPSWAGWQAADTLTDLLPAVIALPTALALVSQLAADRAETRSVAIGQAHRLVLAARELRDANARLARVNDDLSAFAGRIAHDLRSPLGTVVTALETLRRPELDLPEETREFLVTQSLRAATRSVQMIEALLDHANAEGRAPAVTLVDVGELAADVVATLPGELLGTVVVELPPAPDTAWADARLLPLVLQNLVSNALTHGGASLSRIAVATEVSEDGVVVTVADDGPGIPRTQWTSVFTAGTGDGPGRGLGLGLATCQSIVQRHGGRIWIEDSPLGGAAVRFLLPRPVDGAPGDGTDRSHTSGPDRVVELADASDDQRPDQATLATSSSSGSSMRTSVASYRPGSAPTTSSTSRPHAVATRTSPGTV